jgi:uncharacterized membrane protein
MAENVQVFVATFPDEEQAGEVLRQLQRMHGDNVIELIDAAAIVRRADGKVTYTESGDASTKRWATRGAVVGGLVGLIFPPSILVSAALGAGGAGLWGKLRDAGFDDTELKRVGESLPPGGSAVIAIAEDKVIARLERDLADYRDLATYALSADAVAIITAEAESSAEAEPKVPEQQAAPERDTSPPAPAG